MKVMVASNYDEMSKMAAKIIANEIKAKSNAVLGLATGGTPLGTYKELIQMHKKGELDFASVRTFNLDEYLGLNPKDKNSYNFFMWDNLFKHVNVSAVNVQIPKGDANNPAQFCKQYENNIKSLGGIDIQLLGIGRDGHIAFNEPGSPFDSRTRVVDLSQETVEDNARFFEKAEDVPRQAITMGVGTILEAKKILLIANGAKKADICAQFIEGKPTEEISASALQRHKDVTIILDQEAASKLKKIV
ncbi:MAG: glucosamine-6-phosphate deaminase [Candidatus Omnitrophica bacterium]|nr:glucosamine-6-phosphate deaminase [Candidatus Omnitrophota bacterium]HOX54926.1 glucosamine-6-phosphate deaminase [Candidatus Omnitrophota bacterium]